MNFKNILNIIEKEKSFDEYDDYIQDDYDELNENLKKGIFLRDALSEINFIKKFFYKQLNDKGIDIDIDDVFFENNKHCDEYVIFLNKLYSNSENFYRCQKE